MFNSLNQVRSCKIDATIINAALLVKNKIGKEFQMNKRMDVCACSTVFRLRDQTELEVFFVELFDEDFEYKKDPAEYLNALKFYLGSKQESVSR